MFDSALFLVFLIVGFFSFFVSVVILIIGFASDDKKVITIGYKSLYLPAFFLVAMFFYYTVFIPLMNDKVMEEYSSSYFYQGDNYNNELHLETDGTFTCRCAGSLEIPKEGTWETGGVDGLFFFYDQKGILKKFGMPSIDFKDRKVISFPDDPDSDIDFVEIDF